MGPESITLSAAIEIAKNIGTLLRQTSKTLDRSELAAEVNTLLDALRDSRETQLEDQEEKQRLRKEVERLTEALKIKGKLELQSGAYFIKGTDGELVDGPFCVGCWDTKSMAVHMTRDGKMSHLETCPNCEHQVRHQPSWERVH